MTSILAMEPLLSDVLALNLKRLGDFADSKEVVHIDDWVQYFTFDVVGQLAMGGILGFLDRGEDVDGIIGSIHDGFWAMSNMGYFPLQMFWFNNPVSKWIVKHFGGDKMNAFDVFLEWLERKVDHRMSHGLGDARWDMLQHFIDAKDLAGQPVNKAEVMIEGIHVLGLVLYS